MRRARKIAVWAAGVLFCAIAVLVVASPGYNYNSYYPKVWTATITSEGKPLRGSLLYLNRSRGVGVLVYPGRNGRELYAFGASPQSPFVLRCENSVVLFLPALAVSNHMQWAQGCLFRNLIVENAPAPPDRPQLPERDTRIGQRRLEFTTDGGTRVKAEW